MFGSKLSRRAAATVMAGAFAPWTLPVAAAAHVPGAATNTESPSLAALLTQSRATILARLAAVRAAGGTETRGRAFARFKTAFVPHDALQAFVAAKALPGASGAGALYRQEDPAGALARIIVRELDALPQTDALWAARFRDLERALAEPPARSHTA